MALIKNKELNNGFSGEYWRIIDISISYLSKYSHITLSLYKDKLSRDNGLQPISVQNFDWEGDNFPFTEEEPQNERQIAYDKIKLPILDEEGNNINWFSDAENE